MVEAMKTFAETRGATQQLTGGGDGLVSGVSGLVMRGA